MIRLWMEVPSKNNLHNDMVVFVFWIALQLLPVVVKIKIVRRLVKVHHLIVTMLLSIFQVVDVQIHVVKQLKNGF